jgi:hypothetical protein
MARTVFTLRIDAEERNALKALAKLKDALLISC